MEIVAFLKPIYTLCYLYAYIGLIIAGVFNKPLANFIPFIIFCGIINVLCYKLSKKKAKYIPLLLLLGGFIFYNNVWDMGFLSFIIIFMTINIVMNKYTDNQYQLKTNLSNFIKMLFFLLLLIVATIQIKSFAQNFFLSAVIFIASSIMLLRITRANNSLINNKDYKIMNLRMLAIIFILCLLFGNKLMFGIIMAILGFTYNNLIVPILLIPAYLISAFLGLFNFKPFEKLMEEMQINMSQISAEEEQLKKEMMQNANNGEVVTIILAVAFILTVTIVLFYVFKKFSRESYDNVEQTYVKIETEKTDEKKKYKLNEIFSFASSKNPIRAIYKKYLRLIKNNQIPLDNCMTTTEINKSIGKNNDNQILRNIYINARYGEKNIDDNQIKDANNALLSLKRNCNNKI